MSDSLIYSLVVIFIALTFIPLLAKFLRAPVIIVEIFFGIIVGKTWFDIVPDNAFTHFLSSFGLIYLLFLAGLEVKLRDVRENFRASFSIAIVSLAVPFASGFFISGFTDIHPLLLGTIFSTSSLGVILPMTKSNSFPKKFKEVLLPSIILVELISIFLLSLSIAYIENKFSQSFYVSFIILLFLFVIPWVLKKLKVKEKIKKWTSREAIFEMEVRFSFALLLILTAIADLLGFEAIVGAFLAGLIISSLSDNKELRIKLEGFGYGFFIPLFFVFVGAKIDLSSVFSTLNNLNIMLVIIFTAIITNVLGVFIVSLRQGFKKKESLAMGFFHATLLSLTIAAAEITIREELITDYQFSIFVLLAIISTFIGSIFGKRLLENT